MLYLYNYYIKLVVGRRNTIAAYFYIKRSLDKKFIQNYTDWLISFFLILKNFLSSFHFILFLFYFIFFLKNSRYIENALIHCDYDFFFAIRKIAVNIFISIQWFINYYNFFIFNFNLKFTLSSIFFGSILKGNKNIVVMKIYRIFLMKFKYVYHFIRERKRERECEWEIEREKLQTN